MGVLRSNSNIINWGIHDIAHSDEAGVDNKTNSDFLVVSTIYNNYKILVCIDCTLLVGSSSIIPYRSVFTYFLFSFYSEIKQVNLDKYAQNNDTNNG